MMDKNLIKRIEKEYEPYLKVKFVNHVENTVIMFISHKQDFPLLGEKWYKTKIIDNLSEEIVKEEINNWLRKAYQDKIAL